MTPEKHGMANSLAQAHASLITELKAWEALIDPPQLLGLRGHPVPGQDKAGIPPKAWETFRYACLAHVQAAIERNRDAFGKL